VLSHSEWIVSTPMMAIERRVRSVVPIRANPTHSGVFDPPDNEKAVLAANAGA
jgi:hypothetical protein